MDKQMVNTYYDKEFDKWNRAMKGKSWGEDRWLTDRLDHALIPAVQSWYSRASARSTPSRHSADRTRGEAQRMSAATHTDGKCIPSGSCGNPRMYSASCS